MEQENKNQMNGNSGQAPQQDGLYHYSYMNNRGDSRFDRPSTNASQQTQNVQDAQSAQNNQTAGCTWLSTERSDCRRTEFIAECSNSRYTERFIFRFSEKCKWHGSMV